MTRRIMTFNIGFLNLKLVLIACCILFTNNLTIEEKKSLIKSVSQNLYSSSVIIIKGSLSPANDDIVLVKYLSQSLSSYVAAWDVGKIIENSNSRKKMHPKPLIVVNYDDDFILKKLKMISEESVMAVYNWLVFYNSGKEIDEEFQEVVLPLDCMFIVCTTKNEANLTELNEIYHLDVRKISKPQVKVLGYWDAKIGLKFFYDPLTTHKTDLKGEFLFFCIHNFTTTLDPCSAMYSDNGEHVIQCSYFILWRILEKMLNFRTKYFLCEDVYEVGEFGESTTPMLEMIKSGLIDSGGDGYAFSEGRLRSISFLWPLFATRIIWIAKFQQRKMDTSYFVRPFNKNIWYSLLGWIFISSVTTNVLQYLTNKKVGEKRHITVSAYFENGFIPIAALCSQSVPLPTNMKMRIVHLMVYIIPLIFLPSYSGSLTSSLYLPNEIKQINNLDELESDGTYKLGTLNNTFWQTILEEDESYKSFREKKLVVKDYPGTFKESFDGMCSKKLIMGFETPVISTSLINCGAYILQDASQTIFNSLAVRKNFPYSNLFNIQITKLVTSGIHTKLLERVGLGYFNATTVTFSIPRLQFKSISLEELLPVFGILTIGILTSLIVLTMEIFVANKNRQFFGVTFSKRFLFPSRVKQTRRKVIFREKVAAEFFY